MNIYSFQFQNARLIAKAHGIWLCKSTKVKTLEDLFYDRPLESETRFKFENEANGKSNKVYKK